MDEETRKHFQCVDCGICTHTINEYYMVYSRVWRSALRVDPVISERKRYRKNALSTMLCIGCLEQRLGRELTSADFTDCPLNNGENFYRSKRYQQRLMQEPNDEN